MSKALGNTVLAQQKSTMQQSRNLRVSATRRHSQTKSPGDLVMRSILNQKTKLHAKWDGPFVVLASTDNNTYQLSTANGYMIQSLVNDVHLRRLDVNEHRQYRGEFWNVSARLKSHDERAKQEDALRNLDGQLKQATIDHLNA
jgi:predicted secreted hydrolase